MKITTRFAWMVATLSAGLLSSGTTPLAARTGHAEPDYDLLVVQSSADRKLTQADLDQLHAAVARFLASQGPVRSGEYIVRIDFPPTRPGADAEWMIVKLTNLAPPAFSFDDDYAPAETGYAYRYDYGYACSPYDCYDPFGFNPTGYYCSSPVMGFRSGGFRSGEHRTGDRDDRSHGTHARGDGPTAEQRPWDKTARPQIPNAHVGNQPAANSRGDKDNRSRGTRNEVRPAHQPRIQTAENTLNSTNADRRRDAGLTGHSVPLSSERAGVSSFTPPPASARISPPAATTNGQRDKDNGSRRQQQ